MTEGYGSDSGRWGLAKMTGFILSLKKLPKEVNYAEFTLLKRVQDF